MEVALSTGMGVYAILSQICRSPLEAVRQFVENAADAIEMAGEANGRIAVHLNQVDDGPTELSIEDNGAGLSEDKMRQVLSNFGHSEKISLALRGEKGVGILAFALICDELHLSSSEGNGLPSACMVLRRESLVSGMGEVLAACPAHQQSERGTTAHLVNLQPEASATISARRLREYLAREFAADLRAKRYTLAIESNGRWEPIEAVRLRGLPVMSESLPLASGGSVSVDVRVLPAEASDAGMTVYGRGGVRICALSTMEDFQGSTWLDRRLEGFIRCDRLKRSADKTSIVQDRVYFEMIDALHTAALRLRRAMTQVTQEQMDRRLAEVTRRVDTLVGRFLRYVEEGTPLPSVRNYSDRPGAPEQRPLSPVIVNGDAPKAQRAARRPAEPIHFRLASLDSAKRDQQSWGDGSVELVQINPQHPDFLEAEQDVARCSRYLFSLWAKEHLLAEYGSDSRRVAEVLVSWLNKVDPIIARRAA